MASAYEAAANHDPEIRRLADYFEYQHLPEHMQHASAPATEMLIQILNTLPSSPELAAGLRKLLEAKDCFVRAAVKPRKILE